MNIFGRSWRLVFLIALLTNPARYIRAQNAPVQNSGSISGVVCDANGHPLASSEVILKNAEPRTVAASKSDASGRFQFDGLREGTYTLQVNRDDYHEGREGPFVIHGGETKTVMVHLTAAPATAKDASMAIPFSDEPQFTVAGMTDTTALGVHASSRAAPNSTAMAKETAALAHEGDRGNGSEPALESGTSAEALRAQLAAGEDADLRFQLAELEERGGHPLEAAKDYERAAELDPTEPHLFGWGAELLLHRAMEPAIEVFRKGHQRYPASVRMVLGLGASYYAQGSRDEAAQYFLQAGDLEPSDPQPYIFLGRLLATENVTPAGWTERMERFAMVHSENAAAHYFYALALLKQGEVPAAVAAETELEKAIALDPSFGNAYLQLGILLAGRKQFTQAEAALQKAVRYTPFPDEAHYRLAEVYRRTGDAAKARQETAVYKQIEARKAEDAERERHEIQQFIYTLRGADAPR
jgi:tetratricopeptide (TPR) repeat protein